MSAPRHRVLSVLELLEIGSFRVAQPAEGVLQGTHLSNWCQMILTGSLASGYFANKDDGWSKWVGIGLDTTAAEAGKPTIWLNNGGTSTILVSPSGGVLEITNHGGGLRLTSPDGLVTKTITIDNAGALTVS